MLIIGLIILFLKALTNLLYLAKIEAFFRKNKLIMSVFTILDAFYGIIAIKIILNLLNQNLIILSIFYAIGAFIGDFIVLFIKNKIDHKIQSERSYFVRLSCPEQLGDELIDLLIDKGFVFTYNIKNFSTGKNRIIIETTLNSFQEITHLKKIIKPFKKIFVTILHTDDIIGTRHFIF